MHSGSGPVVPEVLVVELVLELVEVVEVDASASVDVLEGSSVDVDEVEASPSVVVLVVSSTVVDEVDASPFVVVLVDSLDVFMSSLDVAVVEVDASSEDVV